MITEFPQELKEQVSMSEDKFWDFVSYADWPNRDYQEVSAEYLRLLSLEECKEFQKIKGYLWGMLDKFIGPDRNPAGGGDDSHGDLICHIIGLGRKQFYAHLNNYELIKARGNAPYNSPEGYVECFAYCIPYDSDYEKKNNTKHFMDFAKRAQEEVDALIEETHPEVLKPIQSQLQKIAYILEFFKNGDFKGGMKQYHTAKGLILEVKETAKNNKFLKKVIGWNCPALVISENFLNDFVKYIEVEKIS